MYNGNHILNILEDTSKNNKTIKEVKEYETAQSHLGYDYVCMFLEDPTEKCIQILLEFGALLVEKNFKYGSLFVVPKTWLFNTRIGIPEDFFDAQGHARLLIPSPTPYIVYTEYGAEIVVENTRDVRPGITDIVQSKAALYE